MIAVGFHRNCGGIVRIVGPALKCGSCGQSGVHPSDVVLVRPIFKQRKDRVRRYDIDCWKDVKA